MTRGADPERQIGLFGLDVPQLIRFLYAGFLAVGLLQLAPIQADLNDRLSSLGNAVSVFAIFGLGVLVWTVYHQVIGELIWFQFIHLLHKTVPRVKDTSDMLLLEELGVPFGKRRMAYQMFRSSYVGPEDRQWVELSHAYNQLLDITWVEIAFVLAYWRGEVEAWALLLVVGSLSALASIYVDIRQHAIERNLMLREGESHFRDWLERAGLLTK